LVLCYHQTYAVTHALSLPRERTSVSVKNLVFTKQNLKTNEHALGTKLSPATNVTTGYPGLSYHVGLPFAGRE
jgi:hypothetical protein